VSPDSFAIETARRCKCQTCAGGEIVTGNPASAVLLPGHRKASWSWFIHWPLALALNGHHERCSDHRSDWRFLKSSFKVGIIPEIFSGKGDGGWSERPYYR